MRSASALSPAGCSPASNSRTGAAARRSFITRSALTTAVRSACERVLSESAVSSAGTAAVSRVSSAALTAVIRTAGSGRASSPTTSCVTFGELSPPLAANTSTPAWTTAAGSLGRLARKSASGSSEIGGSNW